MANGQLYKTKKVTFKNRKPAKKKLHYKEKLFKKQFNLKK